jgi:hypothetical protein
MVGCDKKCTVCRDDLEDGQDIVQPFEPCNHRFHTGCIQPWIQSRHPTCPNCRAEDPALQNQARLRNLEESVEVQQIWLNRVEERLGARCLTPLCGLSEDRITRLEQLVTHDELRLRQVTWYRDRTKLELQSANSGDLSARLDSLQQLIEDHQAWLATLN